MLRKSAGFKRSIEEQRARLYKLTIQKEYTDPEVVLISQQLDKEIYKLQVSCNKIPNKE
ncbi:aspartyl-phosphate phosphatase Spo0E family protein [Gottfriedia acidiceleris]|uniref:aspartyl-phosphate phosphatase Spo0E family protein n=1 Tax=Gottfriedia acidiceleris TaxID=371036 RepID=UPI000B433B94|nr:aspartyl-phosphate phosphatase Spo0E family protein [Gottfriedia acidiceleris]